jgi:putative transposase
VSARVSPTDRVRAQIDALFASDRELSEILEEVVRLGAQLLLQAALEAEVTGFLGRDRYQRAAAVPDAQPGSRNGYRPVTVKTTAGPVTLERPKLRGTTAAFASRLFGKHVAKTHALESLVIASFVRGLSVRDVEATLADALGDQAAISKSTVSEVCKAIRCEYQAWARRRKTSCISIVWAVLDRASRGWRGLTMTPAGLRLLQDLRRSLLEPPRQLRPRPAPTRRISDRPEPASA